MQEDKKKTIAIDFDGVLAEYEPGMASADLCGEPIRNAVEAIQQLSRSGYEIYIFTSRPITANLRAWISKYGLPVKKILQKPDCHLFIDDRAIRFRGDWLATLEEIKHFSEWWRNGDSTNSSNS